MKTMSEHGWFTFKPHWVSFLFYHHSQQEMFRHINRFEEFRRGEPRRAFCLDVSETWQYFSDNAHGNRLVKW